MPDVHEAIGRLEARVDSLVRDLQELEGETVDRANRRSLSNRVHRLENDRIATRAATTALDAARAAQQAVAEANHRRSDRKWTRRQTILATMVAALTLGPTLVLPWVNLYLGLSR